MKKFLLAVFALLIVSATFAQKVTSLKDVQVKKTYSTGNEFIAAPENDEPMVRTLSRNFIGATYYDLQTNGSMSNRAIAHSDGTVSAVWITRPTASGPRGTGYNYFNGSSWINPADHSTRIENENTGWGTIASIGNAEIVVSHNGKAVGGGLVVGICPQKGTNNWTFDLLQGPELVSGSSRSTCLLWPSIATTGNIIHLIACTDNDPGFLYQGIHVCLLYYRGTFDPATNTISWEEPRIVGGVTSDEIKSFSGDSYSIAAKGDNVAIFYASLTTDAFLWKSTDKGVNFTKTVVFQHPYPGYDEPTTLVVDTPYVPDGSTTVALDDNGKAHVAFGITRMLNDSLTDDATSYFPGINGMLYWNENQAPLLNATVHTMDPDSLVAAGYQVFFRSDLNNDGGAYYSADESIAIPHYGGAVVSMPYLVTNNGKVYLLYTALLDWPFMDINNSTSGKYYRGVFGAKSTDNGNTWGDISWMSYNKDCYYLNDWSWIEDTVDVLSHAMEALEVDGENVFPVASEVVNGHIVILWQQDYWAGSVVKDGGSANKNSIHYLRMNPDSIGIYNNTNEVWQGIWIDPTGISNEVISGMKIYPNPASDAVNVTFSSEESSNAVLSIMNLMGQMVYTTNVSIQEGYNMVNVPVNQLRAGIYMVNIKSNKGTSTQKLIVK